MCESSEWAPWTNWGSCSLTCGSGLTSRNRLCSYAGQDPNVDNAAVCGGPGSEEESCNERPCPGEFTKQ